MPFTDNTLPADELEKLLSAIDMPGPMRDALLHAGESPDLPGTRVLREHLALSLANRRSGPWKDLEEEVFIDTMKAFSRFVREHEASYGRCGFDRDFWTLRQANARLFRIGELEYELIEAGVHASAPCLSLHIPGDARLAADLLNSSVRDMRAFMARHFPAWKEAPVFLSSWLLSPVLPSLLPPGSRILRFQEAFSLICADPVPEDFLQWVFGITDAQRGRLDLRALPERTTLQKNMKAFLLSGGQVGIGEGWLAGEFK